MPHFEVEVISRFVVESESEESARKAAVPKLGQAVSEGYADVDVRVVERRSRDDLNHRLDGLPVLSILDE